MLFSSFLGLRVDAHVAIIFCMTFSVTGGFLFMGCSFILLAVSRIFRQIGVSRGFSILYGTNVCSHFSARD